MARSGSRSRTIASAFPVAEASDQRPARPWYETRPKASRPAPDAPRRASGTPPPQQDRAHRQPCSARARGEERVCGDQGQEGKGRQARVRGCDRGKDRERQLPLRPATAREGGTRCHEEQRTQRVRLHDGQPPEQREEDCNEEAEGHSCSLARVATCDAHAQGNGGAGQEEGEGPPDVQAWPEQQHR